LDLPPLATCRRLSPFASVVQESHHNFRSSMTVPNGNGARERSRSRGEQGESLVPIIDIGALSTNDKAAQKAVAQKIGKACEEIGFFVVVNHGIPSDVIDAAWNQTLDFFDLPLDEKKKYVSEDEAKNPYGHLAQLV